MSNAIMNPTNAAAYLSLREGAIVRLAREGMIPYRRIGRRLIFVRAELELWLSQLPGVCVADAVAAQRAQHEAMVTRRQRRIVALQATA
jgi:excisionase family DNA binding protein